MAKKKSEKKDIVKMENKEIEELVLKLAKQGMSPTQIGQTLKNTYGMYSVKDIGGKIKKMIAAHGIKEEIPFDLQNLLKKVEALKRHFAKNLQDKPVKRNLLINESKIRKLSAYHKKKGNLPKDWKY